MNSVVSRVVQSAVVVSFRCVRSGAVHAHVHVHVHVHVVHVVPAGSDTRALGLGLWVWSSLSMVTLSWWCTVEVYGLQSRVPYLTAHQALRHPWPLIVTQSLQTDERRITVGQS